MFMKNTDGCSEHNKYQMKRVELFLSTLNFNIWCPKAHISGIVSIYFLNTLTLMLSHSFWK